jgi:hypothetical protein
MVKYTTTSTPSRNKKLSDQHCFFLFKVTNNVAQFANNGPNQLQTKVNTKKIGEFFLKIRMWKNYNKINDLQN